MHPFQPRGHTIQPGLPGHEAEGGRCLCRSAGTRPGEDLAPPPSAGTRPREGAAVPDMRPAGLGGTARPPWARGRGREVSMSLCGHEAGRGSPPPFCGHEAERGCCGPTADMMPAGLGIPPNDHGHEAERGMSMFLCGHEAGRGFHRPPIGKRLGEDYVVPSRARGRESVTSRSR